MLRHLRKFISLGIYHFQFENKVYGAASKIGGSHLDSLYDQYAGQFFNSDLFNFKAKVVQNDAASGHSRTQIPGITLVTTPEQCQACLQQLMKTDTIVAWDTETMDLNAKKQAPVGKGKIICASFYAGPQYNFGRGPRVFIDNFGKNAGLINYFKPYLQNEKYLKVWHNYGFDRHVFYNHGIDVKGFGGDTMHMARLFDSGKMFGQYSLSSLTSQYSKYIKPLVLADANMRRKRYMKKLGAQKNEEKSKQIEKKINYIDQYINNYSKSFSYSKTKMDQIFKRKRVLKSGQEGVSYEYPNTLTLHTNSQYLQKWIQYSTLDSEATFYLRQTLQLLLKRQHIDLKNKLKTMWELYLKYWRPFGQILTDIEREGIKLDMEHMKMIQTTAKEDLKKKEEHFINFLKQFQTGKNIDHFNPSSNLQLQQLFYAPYEIKPPEPNKSPTSNFSEQDLQFMQNMEENNMEGEVKKNQRKPVSLKDLVKSFKVENKHAIKPKFTTMEVTGLGMQPFKFTPLGHPSVQYSVLQSLAGDPEHGKYGKGYEFFQKQGNPQFGKKFCEAIRVLIQHRNIQTLLKNFIEPLTTHTDQKDRIHCSLNINTQTGRLSCKKPNLQNQPALDKDKYKIRKAFVASTGKKFVVADYGQLQLRVLAHLTNCKAMIEAFKEGGDFHSRTAISMYPYIRKQIEQGTVLLEWDKSKGKAPVPLLKDKFAAERKKAKTVNFSIAYGKSAQGFAEDWNCSLEQAKEVIKRWFSDRPEVEKWQSQKKKIAEERKVTQTLLGRFRKLDKFFPASDPKRLRGMGLRRAINTPIQGGAADIVIASMIKIANNKRLDKLGWKLLLQIHDQLILQGPQQSANQAYWLIKHDMQHPFEEDLLVALQVDAKIGNNWYECK